MYFELRRRCSIFFFTQRIAHSPPTVDLCDYFPLKRILRNTNWWNSFFDKAPKFMFYLIFHQNCFVLRCRCVSKQHLQFLTWYSTLRFCTNHNSMATFKRLWVVMSIGWLFHPSVRLSHFSFPALTGCFFAALSLAQWCIIPSHCAPCPTARDEGSRVTPWSGVRLNPGGCSGLLGVAWGCSELLGVEPQVNPK